MDTFNEKYNAIQEEFLNEFKSLGMMLSKDMVVMIHGNNVTVGLQIEPNRIAFGSDIVIYSRETGFLKRENKINFGSSGSFNPDDQVPYWRTIHAAEFIKNWDKVCEVVNKYCKKVGDIS